MFQRLQLLKPLQDVKLSPKEGMALLERVKTSTWSREDRDPLAKVIRASEKVSDDGCVLNVEMD